MTTQEPPRDSITSAADQEATARHEAGHAIAANTHGRELVLVTIVPEPPYAGSCLSVVPAGDPVGDKIRSDVGLERYEEEKRTISHSTARDPAGFWGQELRLEGELVLEQPAGYQVLYFQRRIVQLEAGRRAQGEISAGANEDIKKVQCSLNHLIRLEPSKSRQTWHQELVAETERLLNDRQALLRAIVEALLVTKTLREDELRRLFGSGS